MKILAGLLFALLLGPVASAQSPVPIEREPRHHLTLENQYVRVFFVTILPGDVSLFHTHLRSGVSTRLTDAQIRDEPLQGKSEDLTVKRGAVTFARNATPLIHRVSNIGQTPFRNIFVEILLPPGSTTTSSLSGAPGHELVLENDSVRVYRLTLAPGGSTGNHTHDARILTIAVTAGAIVVEQPGRKSSKMKLKEGDARWHEHGVLQTMRNAGTAPFEMIEIELR